ncbi:unnamed protein product [Ixodes pacificus]
MLGSLVTHSNANKFTVQHKLYTRKRYKRNPVNLTASTRLKTNIYSVSTFLCSTVLQRRQNYLCERMNLFGIFFTQACVRMRRKTKPDALIAVRAAALWKLR